MAKTTIVNANNCFRNVLAKLALTGNSQGNGTEVAYLILAAQADNLDYLITISAPSGVAGEATGDDYTVADTYANQMSEVLHRLYSYNGFAWKAIAQLFNDFDASVGHPK